MIDQTRTDVEMATDSSDIFTHSLIYTVLKFVVVSLQHQDWSQFLCLWEEKQMSVITFQLHNNFKSRSYPVKVL